MAFSLVRNCKKRLGLMPTQRVNKRWKWYSLEMDALGDFLQLRLAAVVLLQEPDGLLDALIIFR